MTLDKPWLNASLAVDARVTLLLAAMTLDEKVDVLISEPLGIALVNERMIESYLVARDLLLKPGGKMYPDHAVLHASPFCDEALYNEQTQKANFWAAHDFYGIDLSPVQGDAHSFYFSQPAAQRVAAAKARAASMRFSSRSTASRRLCRTTSGRCSRILSARRRSSRRRRGWRRRRHSSTARRGARASTSGGKTSR